MKSKVQIAREIAEKVHLEPNDKYPEGQKDKKKVPYMAHINDIASRVSELGESHEIVALLHDAIEDAHNDQAREEVKNLIDVNFNSEIIEAIDAMTKNVNEDYFSEYLPRLKKNKIALKVKIADSSHNLSKAHLFGDEPETQNELRKKYIAVLDELGVDGQECEEPINYRNGEWTEKKIIYVDMDNVLVNFQSGIDSLTDEQRHTFKDDLDDVPGIFSKMQPVDGAIEAYDELTKYFDVYILSTAPWNNPSAWTDKLIWVQEYLGDLAYKRLILSHNKNLNTGDFLIDDRTANGAGEFNGEHIHFLSEQFKTWNDVLNYLIPENSSTLD